MTGTNPKGLRFHLLNADIDDAVILHLWYQDTLRKDVYKVSVADVCMHLCTLHLSSCKSPIYWNCSFNCYINKSLCVLSFPMQNGIFIEGSNTQYTAEGAIFDESDNSFLPGFDQYSGYNYFDRDTGILHLVSHAHTAHLYCTMGYFRYIEWLLLLFSC